MDRREGEFFNIFEVTQIQYLILEEETEEEERSKGSSGGSISENHLTAD